MIFKRYCWKIKQEKQKSRKIFRNYPILGFRINLFFKSNNGLKLVLSSKIIKLSKIKTKNIQLIKRNFWKKKINYTQDFIKEILKKENRLMKIKEIELRMDVRL